MAPPERQPQGNIRGVRFVQLRRVAVALHHSRELGPTSAQVRIVPILARGDSMDAAQAFASLKLGKVSDCDGLPLTLTCTRYETVSVRGDVIF